MKTKMIEVLNETLAMVKTALDADNMEVANLYLRDYSAQVTLVQQVTGKEVVAENFKATLK